MSISEDDEILQDFLVEAGEILEQLNEQLVDLEQNPEDVELLNAIFRGFHTVKGGAGFLQIENLVNVCHVTENLFDSLRKGELSVTAELMDTVLQVLDVVNEMFAQIRAREDVCAAEDSLIQAIALALEGGPAEESPAEEIEEAYVEPLLKDDDDDDVELFDSPEAAADSSNDVDLFEEEPSAADAAPEPMDSSASGGEISEDEFDKLLDQLHGEGKSVTKDKKKPAAEDAKPAAKAAPAAAIRWQ